MIKPTKHTKKTGMGWTQFLLNATIVLGLLAGWIYFIDVLRKAAFENEKRTELRAAEAKLKSLTK